MPTIRVDAFFDADANVWTATSHDLTGLVVEADTFEQLRNEVLVAVGELIELDGVPAGFEALPEISVAITEDHMVKNPLVA